MLSVFVAGLLAQLADRVGFWRNFQVTVANHFALMPQANWHNLYRDESFMNELPNCG